MDNYSVNSLAGGVSEMTRKKLAKEVVTSEQTLSRVIKTYLAPHINMELLEFGGFFTVNGLQLMRDLMAVTPIADETLGNARQRFVLNAVRSEQYQTLCKSYEPEVDFEIQLPDVEDNTLSDGALAVYRNATLDVVSDDVPDFIGTVSNTVNGCFSNAIFEMVYRETRAVIQPTVAAAVTSAMQDTLRETRDALAYQMGVGK